jgi:Tfp pilus assembly protein PilO
MHDSLFKRLSREQELLVICSAGLLLVLLLCQLWLVPGWQRLVNVNRSVSQYRERIERADVVQTLKQQLNVTSVQLSQRKQALSEDLVEADDLSGLLQMLIQRAKQADIAFVKMQPLAERRMEDYVEYPVELELITSYLSLGQLVASLESVPQMIRLERMALTVTKGTKLEVRLLVNCRLQG